MKTNSLTKVVLSLALFIFMAASVQAQDLVEYRLVDKTKTAKNTNNFDKQIAIQGKLTNKANGKKLADLTSEQQTKKQALNRKVSKKMDTPTKVLKRKALSERVNANRDKMKAARKANMKKKAFDFENSKFRNQLIKKSNQ